LANRVAPEHLELCVADPDALLPAIRNAGAVFMGHYTPEPIGDYYAGPNHVLPTSGTARFFSALGVDQYTKRMSVVRYTETALMADAQDIMTLAQTEGLFAHANAIKVRI
jgi:histidinol dehydrogenase